MDDRRSLVCPVLVGRDDLLALADRRIAEVLTGTGRFLLLSGEAGVGKTRLLGAMERRAEAAGFRVVRGGAYPSDVQVPAAILIDVARAMERQPALAEIGLGLGRRLEDADAWEERAGGDPRRRRRVLVLDVAEILDDLSADGPAVLALEDLHWSDDLTLEILEALARRVPERRLLVVGTYRSDELFPRAPMREWRSRLLARRQAEEVRLDRLTAADTTTMTTLLVGSGLPLARDVAAAIHERTDGIPLHVEELLAVLAGSSVLLADEVRHADVPETVEDAVLARLARRSDAAAAVARAGAVIGRSFDLELLASVTGQPPEDLSGPLAELADHFILLPAHAPGRYGFRHGLICDAIYSDIPEPERRRLHSRTAEAASRRSDVGADAFLALHYERAGRREEAFGAALAAAEAASALSSHSEARELYACAIRTAPADQDPATRARILEAYGSSAAATDDNETASEAFVRAREAYLAAGQPLAAAAVVGPLVAARHLLGDALEARADRLRSALEEIPAAPALHGPSSDPAADRVRARLLSALSAAYMLDRRLDQAIDYGIEARRGRSTSATAPLNTTPPRRSGRATSSRAGWTKAGPFSRRPWRKQGAPASILRRRVPTGCWAPAHPYSSSTTARIDGSAKASTRPNGTSSGITGTTWLRIRPTCSGRWAVGPRQTTSHADRSRTGAAGSRRASPPSTCSGTPRWGAVSSLLRRPRSRRRASWDRGCASSNACPRRGGVWPKSPWRAATRPMPSRSPSKRASRPRKSKMRRTSSHSSSPARGRTLP